MGCFFRLTGRENFAEERGRSVKREMGLWQEKGVCGGCLVAERERDDGGTAVEREMGDGSSWCLKETRWVWGFYQGEGLAYGFELAIDKRRRELPGGFGSLFFYKTG
jgi:hypothetical protein